MENEMVVAGQNLGIMVTRDPNQVLAEAHRAAKALKDLVSKKEKPVMMNGEQYLEYEDWQTCAKFYNVTAKVVSTQYVEIGGARGFEARAVAIDNGTGQEISAAESLCLNDEDKWSTRSKYEYRGGKREKVGDVPVPLFQLKSMAQTRACAKVLRNVLAWVVVLAGYKPNVAEEMTGDEVPADAKPPIDQPKAQTAPSTDGILLVSIKTVKTGIDEKTKKPWAARKITTASGQEIWTYDDDMAILAEKCIAEKKKVSFDSEPTAKGGLKLLKMETVA